MSSTVLDIPGFGLGRVGLGVGVFGVCVCSALEQVFKKLESMYLSNLTPFYIFFKAA